MDGFVSNCVYCASVGGQEFLTPQVFMVRSYGLAILPDEISDVETRKVGLPRAGRASPMDLGWEAGESSRARRVDSKSVSDAHDSDIALLLNHSETFHADWLPVTYSSRRICTSCLAQVIEPRPHQDSEYVWTLPGESGSSTLREAAHGRRSWKTLESPRRCALECLTPGRVQPTTSSIRYRRRARRYAAGVSPVTRRNHRVRCAWSANPASAAMAEIGRLVPMSRSAAQSTRRRRT